MTAGNPPGRPQEPDALARAVQLGDWLRRGGQLQPVACSIRLDPAEVAFVESGAWISQYLPAPVMYGQSTYIDHRDRSEGSPLGGGQSVGGLAGMGVADEVGSGAEEAGAP